MRSATDVRQPNLFLSYSSHDALKIRVQEIAHDKSNGLNCTQLKRSTSHFTACNTPGVHSGTTDNGDVRPTSAAWSTEKYFNLLSRPRRFFSMESFPLDSLDESLQNRQREMSLDLVHIC